MQSREETENGRGRISLSTCFMNSLMLHIERSRRHLAYFIHYLNLVNIHRKTILESTIIKFNGAKSDMYCISGVKKGVLNKGV